MILNILWIVVGVALVLWGADRMTDGAVALAQRMNIPQIVIGLTIVAMGTSAPELFVSLMSAIRGTADLAVGNVVGSNIFNTFLIVGVAALVAPMIISKTTVKKDIPWAVISAVALTALCWDADISRLDALILFVGLIIFLLYTLHVAKKGQAEVTEEEQKNYTPLKSILLILLGLACLVGGSNLFVEGATQVAAALGVSEAVIGLTVVAGGTSLPELATSVVAARKGQSAIAIGNVIGSNVFNILMILGITGLIQPMRGLEITAVDLTIMLVGMVLLWLFSFTKYKVERWEGAVLTLIFLGYMSWLIYQAV
ncbi:MAG: calcium/sodium antiporter [Prevotella sp.]|nr:calcium/sodium antiporter [Prevotella sp.]